MLVPNRGMTGLAGVGELMFAGPVHRWLDILNDEALAIGIDIRNRSIPHTAIHLDRVSVAHTVEG